jgi:ubiquinone biosynthesis protein
MLVLENNVICYLDYGMMGVIRERTKEYLIQTTLGVVKKDSMRITKGLINYSDIDDTEIINDLEDRIRELMYKHSYKPIAAVNSIELFNDSIQLFIDFKIKLPSDLYLLIRAIIMSQSLGLKLNPEFNIVEHIKPFAKSLIKKRITPKTITNNLLQSFLTNFEILQDLPLEVKYILKKLQSGNIKVQLEHNKLDKIIHSHEQISNRIAFSIIVASMIIGSSLIILSKIPPLWNDVPIIGIAGFVTAGILGFGLVISIIKHGKI